MENSSLNLGFIVGFGGCMKQTYWDLKREMSNLRVVADKQAEVLRKLKRNPTGAKKGKSVFAVTDLTNTNR